MSDEQPKMRQGREGSRWINQRPTGEDVAKWFKDNVPLHEELKEKADQYVQGVTLIPQKEKSVEVIGVGQDGITPLTKEIENRVYTPYAKVETRVKYFHDLMAAHDDWLGVIEPVVVEHGKKQGLPPGFFSIEVNQTKQNLKPARFICCSMRVRIYKRDTVKEERVSLSTGRSSMVEFRRTGELIVDAPPGTKMVSALNRYGEADPFVMMKAETGAVGRALALAGMLVIPGTGVASAEDMQEAAGAGDTPPPEAGPQAPPAEVPPEQVKNELLREASEGIATLRADYPEAYKQFSEWGRQRGIGKLEDLDSTALRGLATKVRKTLEDAAKAAEEAAEAEGEGAEAEAAEPEPPPES